MEQHGDFLGEGDIAGVGRSVGAAGRASPTRNASVESLVALLNPHGEHKRAQDELLTRELAHVACHRVEGRGEERPTEQPLEDRGRVGVPMRSSPGPQTTGARLAGTGTQLSHGTRSRWK